MRMSVRLVSATKNDNIDPIANKHLKLALSNWRKLVDPDLRPSPDERDRIQVGYNLNTRIFAS
jgi:hypothetical protein